MSADWLNRIGIVLNCLAGFMMAPDIVGRPRLNVWEEALEARAEKVRQFAERRYKKFHFPFGAIFPFTPTDVRITSKAIAGFVFIMIMLSIMFWWLIVPRYIGMRLADPSVLVKIGIVVFLPILVGFACFGMIYLSEEVASGKLSILLENFGMFLTLVLIVCLIFIWGIPIGLLILIVYLFPRILADLLSYVLKKMEGTDRFTSIFVKAGVVLFILGNLLQLLGTIKPNK